MFDVKKVAEEARKELEEDDLEKLKEKVKEKLIQINKTKKILKRLEMELEDLYVEHELNG